MGFFDRNSKKTQVSNISTTDIDTTNVQQTDQSVNTGRQFREIGGSVVVTDSSPEVITLATTAVNRQADITESIAAAAGNAVSGIAQASSETTKAGFDFAGDINASSLESVTNITDRAFDSQDRALDTVAQTGREATGFLTQLTDNVLARDAVQNIAARTEGQLGDALRAIEGVGTTGSQNTEQQRNLVIGVIVVGIAAMFFLGTRKKAS